MSPLHKINLAALNWERTRDPKYKKEWYDRIKKWSRSLYNPKQVKESTNRNKK
jgi:hypothetical protein